MNWFSILKVEDIDFDKDIEQFGFYGEAPWMVEDNDMDSITRLIIGAMAGQKPELKEIITERIRIGHARIYNYLKTKLDKEPTEKQLSDFIIRTIMHEATHAGMGEEQDAMAQHQAEYGAFTGQFPESTYIRLRQFLQHPATERRLLPDDLAQALGFGSKEISRTPDIIEKVEEILSLVDGITEDMPRGKKTDDIKEKLTRLEMQAKTQRKDRVGLFPSFNSIKEAVDYLVNRYGEDNREFVEAISKPLSNDSEEKMAGAVTTTSAPSMFNSKVVKPKKERDEYD